MKSFKPEVQTAGDGEHWSSNALRFATHDEASKYVHNLMMRWTAVRDIRVVESEDPVNYVWVDGVGERPLDVLCHAIVAAVVVMMAAFVAATYVGIISW